MSLATTASVWVSDEPTKKRIPTIRRTMKKVHVDVDEDVDETQDDEIDRNSRVSSLLEKMTSMNVLVDDAGSGLTNFQPLDYPETQQKGIVQQNLQRPMFPPIARGEVPIKYASPTSPYLVEQSSDYNKSYEIPKNLMPASSQSGSRNDDKISDRLGYIVHLLERQQDEKTDNVLEEYILYVLLGTFVIFVIDSFSRSARYIR